MAVGLGFSSTVAHAQEATPTPVSDATVSAESEAAVPAIPVDQAASADTNNADGTEAETSAADANDTAEASTTAEAINQPDITQTVDTTNQSQKASSNPTLRTVGIIAGVVSVLGLIGGGIFWAIQQNLINIPGLPQGLPNPFAPNPFAPNPAPAPAPEGKHYPNCRAVWDELGRPIRSDEPGYDRNLDHDGDGVGCEQRPR